MSKTRGVPLSAGQRKFVAELTQQVVQMVIESGDPNGFDAAAWVRCWINKPNAALGLRRPVEFFDEADGRVRIVRLLAMMQSGAFA
ncbi:MbcA/ParS/Xre antitoxin family protein [Paraburkholderia sediminicola]|uniref:MbcA/ParS/Xre antitoxin family protein n=1 Tax=Paraburkholderia sediminicola TaxID=458836 RepID=UPI0038BB7365